MARKAFITIISDMIDYIRYKNSNIDTEIGSITRDVVIEPVADSIEGIYAENEHVGFLHSFFYYNNMTEDELDALAYNYGITRNPAISATGVLTFRKNTAITEDIAIPINTIVSTKKTTSDPAIIFHTTEIQTMYASESSSYYNSDTGYYEIDVNIEADVAGEDGNVSVNSILLLQSAVAGIDSVINKIATTGGSEKETNVSLANRALLALTGNNVGTADGYLSTVLSNQYVYDALLVGPGDTLMTRDSGLGGKVDIYVSANLANSNTYTNSTYSYTYTDLSEGSGATDVLNDKILPLQPVKSITSIIGSVTGTFIQNTDYELQITSTSNVYYGSVSALDKIHWLTNTPQAGETITITYQYYSIVQDLVDLVDANRPVTADVLIKLAIPISINVTVIVYADDTISEEGETDFQNAIISAITTFVTTTSLARVVQQSDIVNQIYGVSGVDRITLPFTALNAPAKSGYETGVHDSIPINSQEYTTAGTISVSVIRSN